MAETPGFSRFRSRRRDAASREACAETPELGPEHFVVPLFLSEELEAQNHKCTAHSAASPQTERRPIAGLREVWHLSIDGLCAEVERNLELGLRHFLLFASVPPASKDACGSIAQSDEALLPRALRVLRKRFGADLCLISDICLCPYTSHGHCGVLSRRADGEWQIDNDATLPHYVAQALLHARAGADMVAPSGMMDGQVLALRRGLDAAGLGCCRILAYSAKYASALYGPFREAQGSRPSAPGEETPELQHRRSYQMDLRNSDEALAEVAADLAEGADAVMVKPALMYLDIVQRVALFLAEHGKSAVRDLRDTQGSRGSQAPQDATSTKADVPLLAYHVSGEYMMWRSAVEAGVLEEWPSLREMYLSLRRAGAAQIISYAAARYLQLQNAQ